MFAPKMSADKALAFDTSNYTTSAAVFDGAEGRNESRLLTVKAGELGLRQSEALFQHVQRLPGQLEKLAGAMDAIRAKYGRGAIAPASCPRDPGEDRHAPPPGGRGYPEE